MRNLLVLADVASSLELDDAERIEQVCSGDGKLYMATSRAQVLCLSQDTFKVVWRTSVGADNELATSVDDAPASASDPPPRTFAALAYVLELDAVCAALHHGTLLLLRGEASNTMAIEEVGEFEGGIAALEWSPAGDVAAIADAVGGLLFLTQEWEPIAEVTLPGAPALDVGCVALNARTEVALTWRGDGKFLASLSRARGASAYLVHIWDREGCALHSTGQATPGLTPTLAWQPNGRHLYVAQQLPQVQGQEQQQQRVVLFERNGLQHGEFELPSSSGLIDQLAWSMDSELLAVACRPPHSAGSDAITASQQCMLQVWHRRNWHWYLKHSRQWPAAAGPLLLRWDDAVAGRLHCVLAASGACERMDLGWDSCVSALGTAAVVDGSDVLLTPLRHSVIPPPMFVARARFPEPLVAAAWGTCTGDASSSSSSSSSGEPAGAGADAVVVEALAGLTASGRLGLLRSVEEDLWEETLLEQQDRLPSAAPAHSSSTTRTASGALQPHLRALMVHTPVPLGAGRRLRSVCWTGPASLLLLAAPYPEAGMEDGEGDVLIEVTVAWAANSAAGTLEDAATVAEGGVTYAGGRVLRVDARIGGGAVVQLDSGQLLHFRPAAPGGGLTILTPFSATSSFPVPCAIMRATPPSPSMSSAAVTPPAAGLSARGDLYWGSIPVASEATSLAVRRDGAGGAMLVYTTRKSLMYVVSLAQLADAAYTHSDRLAADQERDGTRGGHGRGGAGAYRMARPTGGHYEAMHAAMRPDAATAAARDVMVRAVEEGSQLIAVPAGGIDVVLQMPRGNLETVRPRPLVLAATAAALRAGDYAAAWQLATVNRLDLNVIVDFRWPLFLDAADRFVAAVPKAADICDLLFALRPESIVAGGGLYALLAEVASTAGGSAAARAAGAGGGAAAGPGNGDAPGAPRGAAAISDTVGVSGAEAAGGKINAVCAALRRVVEARLSSNAAYINVVVTTCSRSWPPRLEDALRCIRDAKEAELGAGTTDSSNAVASVGQAAAAAAGSSSDAAPVASTSGRGAPVGGGSGGGGGAERALRHLLLTVDADALYRVALGMYELPLAYMVIASAQRDPGEYMMELQAFAAIPDTHLRHHRIDMQLKRHASALQHLVAAGTQHFNQALSLAREHGLLRQLLGLVQEDNVRRPQVLEAHGAALEQQQKLEDAAVAYAAAGCHERAMHAYRCAGQWQMVLTLAGRHGLSSVEQQQLAADIAEELQAGGQLPAAAAVLEQYLGDADTAVTLLSDARHWREAQRVAYKHMRSDLVETVVAPAAAEAAAALLATARESVERIAKYLERLHAVRQRRLDMETLLAAAEEDGEAAPHDDDADAQSDASTVGGLSVYTDRTHTANTASSSSRGGSQGASTQGGRKRYTGKKKKDAQNKIRQGSPQEESALVTHLLGLSPSPALLGEAAQLLELLILLGHLGDARTLQQQLAAWSAAHQAACNSLVAGGPTAVSPADAPVPPTAAPTAAVAWKWDILRAV